MSAGNWFKDKTWSISGNKESTLTQLQQDVKQNDAVIYYPESTKEIAELLASNQKSAVAVVCGGHSSSNVATWAYHSVSEGASCEGNDDSTIILDMKNMSSVTVDKESLVDFVIDAWIGDYLEKAPLSLVEIRSLGGATKEGSMLPSGNVNALFFADMIVSYDGSSVSSQNKSSIKEEVHRIIVDAKKQGELTVDFSGTHTDT